MKKLSAIEIFSESLAKKIKGNEDFYNKYADELHAKNMERRVNFRFTQIARIIERQQLDNDKFAVDLIHSKECNNFSFDDIELTIKVDKLHTSKTNNDSQINKSRKKYIKQNSGVDNSTPFCMV